MFLKELKEWAITYRQWLPNRSLPITIKWNRSLKITIVSVSVGIGLIVLLSSLLRRKPKSKRVTIPRQRVKNANSILTVAVHESSLRNRGKSPSTCFSPLDGISGRASVASLRRAHKRTESYNSVSTSASCNTITNDEALNLSSEYLCETGIDYLHRAIDFWVEAINKIEETIDEGQESETKDQNEKRQQILLMIEKAYKIRDYYENNLSNIFTNTALDTAIETLDRDYEIERKKRSRASTITSWDGISSDDDSFVSADDVADLSDLEDQQQMYQNYAIYESALQEIENATVLFRSLRTKNVGCNSDTEFLAKLYCLRITFDSMFANPVTRKWFIDNGKLSLSNLLVLADRDPDDFETAFDEFIEFISVKENWVDIEDELKSRGVKCLNFYDIVLDFLIMDAFDDLENPPSSITSVVNNRWLSDGFKETALATCVWSILKAKRRMLKYPKGFMSHFYAMTEHISPVLAWGFLGPSGDLQNASYIFKDNTMNFIWDIFNFDKVRFTSVEHLVEDVVKLSKERFEILLDSLSTLS